MIAFVKQVTVLTYVCLLCTGCCLPLQNASHRSQVFVYNKSAAFSGFLSGISFHSLYIPSVVVLN